MPATNKDFTFQLNVSVGYYRQKPKSPQLIQYSAQALTISDLDRLQKQGKAFCYNFKDVSESGLLTQHEKTLEGFDYTNIIFFDIDQMPIPMEEYISPIPFKPTLAYTTASNGAEGCGYRYRLLYAFDTPISSTKAFDDIYYAVAAANGFEARQYDDGTKYEFDYRKPNQQYYGGGQNSKSFKTDIIYSISDFNTYVDNGHILRDKINIIHSKKNSFPFQNEIRKKENTYYSELENDLNTLSPKAFIDKYAEMKRDYLNSLQSPLIPSPDGRYFTYPEDYQEVKRNWVNRRVEKWQVGSDRKKRMYITAQIMRFNCKDITREQLIYNLVCERFYYYDNSDDKLNNRTIIAIADSALGRDIVLTPCKHPSFTINKNYWNRGNITPNEAKNMVRKEINEERILSLYDFNLSVKDNLKILKDNNIKVGKSTLYNLIKRLNNSFPIQNEIRKKENTYYSEMENEICNIKVNWEDVISGDNKDVYSSSRQEW